MSASNRVLVTGGAGTIGAAVVRRLLGDPAWEVRVSDQREAPQWMREGCEVHVGDLRDVEQAREATRGCSHVIHLAAIVGGIANFHRLPHTLTEVNNALYNRSGEVRPVHRSENVGSRCESGSAAARRILRRREGSHQLQRGTVRTHPRPRRELHPVAFALLRPFLTFSSHREAWILVAVGNRMGPVVRRRQPGAAASGSRHPPNA